MRGQGGRREQGAKRDQGAQGQGKAGGKSVIDYDAVERFLRECQTSGDSFALFACSNEPHGPYSKGRQYRERYPPEELQLRPNFVDTPATRKAYRNYLAEITFFDAEVGRLLALLQQYGHADNTLVVVVSEQGSAFPGGKWTCYDKGLQSAFVARWPGRIAPGTTSSAMVEYVDFLPTFVEIAGARPRKELDGRSFLPVLLGEQHEHKSVVFGVQTSRGIFNGPPHYAIRSIRDQNYKLVLNLSSDQKFRNYVVKDGFFAEWKARAAAGDAHAAARVAAHSTRPPVELYDIQNDPLETENLAAADEHAATIARLQTQLEEWMRSQGDRGLETEMDAYSRMTKGNPAVSEFHRRQRLTTETLFAQPRPERRTQPVGDVP